MSSLVSSVVDAVTALLAKVMELVLSLGSSAKPLAPKSFVDKWKEEVTAMFESLSE